jgi:hypothetical protein
MPSRSSAKLVFVCPHFSPEGTFVNGESREQILSHLFSKASLTRSEDKELFDFTHHPMIVFRDKHKIHEHRLLEEFREASACKVVMVIEGNTGTGKSELCAWLAFRLQERGRHVLSVRKNDNLIDVLTIRIPEFYKNMTGEDLQWQDALDTLKTALKKHPVLVASIAAHKTVMKLADHGHLAREEDDLKEISDTLAKIVQERIKVLITPADEFGLNPELVDPNDFAIRPELNVFETPEESARTLNEELWSAIREQYKTPSLDQMLIEVSKKLMRLRPIIVFEDFAIAHLDQDRLIRYMESDNPEDRVDFIVAGTQNRMEVFHTRPTAAERFLFYMTTDENQVAFLNDESSYQFIRQFILYPKIRDRSVTKTGEIILGSTCDGCRKCPSSDLPVFPFNEAFLRRIFKSLPTEEKKPRKFVNTVYGVLRQYAEGKAPFEADVLRELSNEYLISEQDVPDERIRGLARWYGAQQDGSLRFREEYARLICVESKRFTHDDFIEVPLYNGEVGGSPPEDEPVDEEVRDKLDRLTARIEPWREKPYSKDNVELNEHILKGLKGLLGYATGDFTRRSTSELKIKIGENEHIICFNQNSLGDAPIVLDCNTRDFTTPQLLAVLRFEASQGNKRQVLRDKAIEICAYPLGVLIEQYNEVFETHLSKIQASKCGTKGLKGLALASVQLLMLLEEPLRPIDTRTLIDRVVDDEPFRLNITVSEILGPDQSLAVQVILTDNSSAIRSLVIDQFFMTSDRLDPTAVEDFIRKSPLDYFEGWRRRHDDDFFSSLKIGDTSLMELGNEMRSVAQHVIEFGELFAVEAAGDLERVRDYLSDTKITCVRELTKKLRNINALRQDDFDALNRLVDLGQEQLDDYIENLGVEIQNCGRSSRLKLWEKAKSFMVIQALRRDSLYVLADDLMKLENPQIGPIAEVVSKLKELQKELCENDKTVKT